MDRIILLIAALVLLMNTGCGDDLGYVEVPEADASVEVSEADASTFIPADFCGDGTYFDELEGECLPVYDDEEDPILPEPPHEEEDPELPPEEEEEEPPACEEGEGCLPIETPEDPEVPEEPNWVYLKSPSSYFPSDIQEVGDGCTVPYGSPSSRVHIVVRVDADDYWGQFFPTDWVVADAAVEVTSGQGTEAAWRMKINGKSHSEVVLPTNPCETD